MSSAHDCSAHLKLFDFVTVDYNPHLQLPPWVPDWSITSRQMSDRYSLHHYRCEPLRASGDCDHHIRVLSATVLQMQGIVIDTVLTVGEIFQEVEHCLTRERMQTPACMAESM